MTAIPQLSALRMEPRGPCWISRRSTSLSALSCSTLTTCVAVGVASGGGATSLSTNESPDMAIDDLDPNRFATEFNCVPQRDHLCRRRNQPRFHALRRRDFEYRFNLVDPEPSIKRRRSHRYLLLGCRGLHRRGKQRQHRSGFDDHGDDDRRSVLGQSESAHRYEPAELCFVSEHSRVLRCWSELSPGFRRRRTRMERRLHSSGGQRLEWHLMPNDLRVHGSRVRHLWESSRDWDIQWWSVLDAGGRAIRRRILDGGLMREPIHLLRSERLRFRFAKHHQNRQRRGPVVA